MNSTGVGRVLVASLHQGISDIAPTRLEFYENWLNPTGLREGRIGLAPLNAVLSFLRRERDIYNLVVGRAGECAAEWTYLEVPSSLRRLAQALPQAVRTRVAFRLVRRLVRGAYDSSHATIKLRHGVARINVRGSIFCGVREPSDQPLCGFYAAAVVRLLHLLRVESEAHVPECRGAGDRTCLIVVNVLKARAEDREAVAA